MQKDYSAEIKKIVGKLAPLLFRDDLEEIMVIGPDEPVYVFDRKKGTIQTELRMSEEEINSTIQNVAKFSGRVVDSFNPLLDGRLPDGSRVNATLAVVTPMGATITIRKSNVEPLTILDLLRFGTLDTKLAGFLWLMADGLNVKPANILVIGGTASGKTTTLNALSNFIPEDKRIVSIEDILEINLRHKHWVPMETKPPDRKGSEISMDALLKNSLRMRPDRLIVGEVRAEEALTLFTAMNTGHDGCLATLHANSARETLTRLQNHPMNVPDVMLPALDLIIAQKRYSENGHLGRKIFEVAEVAGREGKNILTNKLFEYDFKSSRFKVSLMNGRIIQELAGMSSYSIKELDEEIYRRGVVLELMVDYELEHSDLHRFIQGYYKDPDKTMENLHEELKNMKKVHAEVS